MYMERENIRKAKKGKRANYVGAIFFFLNNVGAVGSLPLVYYTI
jgi:hypothetical protein